MDNIKILENKIPFRKELLNLYADVGWTAYTDEPERLEKAMNHSLKVWTAWKDRQLITLARVVGDGYTIIYIQYILVRELETIYSKEY